jgi:enoyl-CoA hydratase
MIEADRYEHLRVDRDGAILIITFNRPERLNAVNRVLHEEIGDFLPRVEDDPCRVVILTGAGRAFCAGADIHAVKDEPIAEWNAPTPTSSTQRRFHDLLALTKPIIAAVNGPAVGLGCSLALMCDIVVMSRHAKIGDTHINVGLVPGDGGTALLPMLVGINRAREMLMTGELIDGAEAYRIGLVNHVVEPEEVMPKAREIANRLMSKAPYALAATKAALNRIMRQQVLDTIDASVLYEHVSLQLKDHQEAINAFVEKREPRYTGW